MTFQPGDRVYNPYVTYNKKTGHYFTVVHASLYNKFYKNPLYEDFVPVQFDDGHVDAYRKIEIYSSKFEYLVKRKLGLF